MNLFRVFPKNVMPNRMASLIFFGLSMLRSFFCHCIDCVRVSLTRTCANDYDHDAKCGEEHKPLIHFHFQLHGSLCLNCSPSSLYFSQYSGQVDLIFARLLSSACRPILPKSFTKLPPKRSIASCVHQS